MRLFFLLIFISFSNIIFAKTEFLLYPAGGYSDETGFEIGALSFLRFVPVKADSISNQNSNIYLLAKCSTQKQFLFSFLPQIYLQDKNYLTSFNLEFRKWPSDFYGIGKDADYLSSERYTPLSYFLGGKIERKILERIFFSLQYDAEYYKIIDFEENSFLQKYHKSSLTSGASFGVIYDSRNGISYPTSGSYSSFSVSSHHHILGSDYDFVSSLLDVRKYFSINDLSVLSFQIFAGIASGDVPFFRLYRLDDYLRGVPTNLHKDSNMGIIRSEYKFFPWQGAITKKIVFATFLELGNVFESIENYEISKNIFNYGFGFRYTLFKGDRLNFRFDLGFGEHEMQIIIMASEAF